MNIEAFIHDLPKCELHVHIDAVVPGAHVLVVDDLLATGGTLKAGCQLIEKAGGVVAGCAFLVELDFLHGRDVILAMVTGTPEHRGERAVH